MSFGLSQSQLAGSFYSYWRDAFCSSVPTVYPGMQIDTDASKQWVELWIQSVLQRGQRVNSEKLADVSILVHCFSYPTTEPNGIQKISDDARSLLSQQTLAIRDFEKAGVPVVGYLKLFEAESRVFSREQLRKGSGLQHVIVTCDGIAQSIAG